jgi:hypothetical protein
MHNRAHNRRSTTWAYLIIAAMAAASIALFVLAANASPA